MLQTQSVGKPLWDTLKNLQKNELFKNYFLVGGTALSLQLGHRLSNDIDLFTRDDVNKDEILAFLNRDYNGIYQIHNMQNTVLQVGINGVKVDFVKYDYDLIEGVYSEDGVRYLGKKDISAMKLMAIANRGDQAKDFVDVYYLLKETKLGDMFEYYKIKYKQNDVSQVKRSLVYFDDVTESNWASVRLLADALSAKKIKLAIVNEVNEYNKNISVI